MVCPRQVAWQLLFLAALVLNIVLLVYSFVSPRVSSSCVPNTGRSHTPQHDMKVEATQQYKPNRKASRETSSVLHYATRDCNKELEEGSLAQYLCRVEASVSFYSPPYPKPLVIAKDVTYSRYFAQRDLQAWTLAFNNISFSVSEVHRKTIHLADLTVFICLGIVTQDKHCLRPSSYHYLRHGQKFNQIHGVRESLWRKDGMCFMLREALATYDGPHDFTFPCWVLPTDIPDLRKKMESDPKPYIIKPNSKGEGHGIFIVETIEQLDSHVLNAHVAQPLLTTPYLIQGKKFDFRTYVLVTSASPLRAYFYHEGLVRFASSKYNNSEANKGNESQVLTNTSIGKKYSHISNLTWTFQHLRQYLTTQGVDADQVFSSIQEAIVRTLLAAEYRLLRDFRVSLGGYDCHQCYQLLGVDVILDSELNPFVIEVNGLPSMQLSNELGAPPDPTSSYTLTKFGLLHDMLQILFNTSQSVTSELERELEILHVGVKPGPLCDPLHHVVCIDFKDLQKLIDSKREYINRGNFKRIYPSLSGQIYSNQIYHMHKLIQKHFEASGFLPPRTLWKTHYLYLALERLYLKS